MSDDQKEPKKDEDDKVKFFLHGNEDDSVFPVPPVQTRTLFCELEELEIVEGKEVEWKETARWIKFEEDVEEGDRWSKPHVASLTMHALFELKQLLISNGHMVFDINAQSIVELADAIMAEIEEEGVLSEEDKLHIGEIVLLKHHHLFEKKKHIPVPNIHFKRRGSDEDGDSILIAGKSGSDLHKHDKHSAHDKHFARWLSTHGHSRSMHEHGNDAHELSDHVHTGHEPHIEGKHFVKHDAHPHGPHGHGSSAEYLQHLEKQNGGMARKRSSVMMTDIMSMDKTRDHKLKPNVSFMRHVPKDAEAANILVGTASFLSKPFVMFVRMHEGATFSDLTEIPIPTKFFFLLLGPGPGQTRYHEVGRCMSTLLSDELFQEVAYRAKSKADIINGFDKFIESVIVLPPGEWDSSIRIEPPTKVPSLMQRRAKSSEASDLSNGGSLATLEAGEMAIENKDEADGESGGHGEDPALLRTGRIFGGLVADIKRKAPFYLSDFKDGIALQSIASFIYIFIVRLAPIVTFGGLLGAATDNHMAAMEGILAGAITGITWALFSGQPLNIIGATGPMLIFETILYNFCRDNGLEFLTFRLWIGLWVTVLLLIIVMFDLSSLVRYITRFTEESFASLICIIYIVEAIISLLEIGEHFKVNTVHNNDPHYRECTCVMNNWTATNYTDSYDGHFNETHPHDWEHMSFVQIRHECDKLGDGYTTEGHGCEYIPDVFFFSCVLFIGTFAISYFLKMFKTSPFTTSKIREIISDYNVVLAVLLMVLIDWAVGLETPKLVVPSTFSPTRPDRPWVIPFFGRNPWWTIPLALVPALLATILVFLDQQITAVIVNRKENKLKKGVGYHLDLLVLAVQIAICSILGLPWYVAATVMAVSHVLSLRKESEVSAPGEVPQFLGVRENRLTSLVVGLLTAVSVLLTNVFRLIPFPVLYGVFLYMGISSLNGIQLMDRILLFFMSSKTQPDYMYLRHVRTWRVHLFTIIQLTCLGILTTIKEIKSISIAFPLMVLAICFIRKGLECFFTANEIKELDDPLPEVHKREKEEAKKAKKKKVPTATLR